MVLVRHRRAGMADGMYSLGEGKMGRRFDAIELRFRPQNPMEWEWVDEMRCALRPGGVITLVWDEADV